MQFLKNIAWDKLLMLVCIALASAFASIYMTDFAMQVEGVQIGRMDTVLKAAPLGVLVFVFLLFLVVDDCRYGRKLFKYRYWIGGALFVLAVAFEVSGSSVAQWANVLGETGYEGTLWGEPRPIRSDEWANQTPWTSSQDQTGYMPTSEVMRGTDTSVALLPLLPTYSALAVFKPFYWGYLAFGLSHGVAWFWAGRVIGLFLVTIEFFMMLTKGNKALSVAAAAIMTFSPYAQWWGCFDVLLFGQLIVLLLNGFLRCGRKAARVTCAVAMPWCAGCYIFIVYPAWMVPCFFVFLVVGIWVIASYVKERKAARGASWVRQHAADVVVLDVAVVVFVALMVVTFMDASESVKGMADTVYPGKRLYTGGDGAGSLFDWVPSVFFALDQNEVLTQNPCENSAYFSLFPLGLVLGVFMAWRKRSGLLWAMIALEAAFLFYMLVGVPEFVAKVTLLSNVGMANRFLIATGFLDVAILFVALSMMAGDRNAFLDAFCIVICAVVVSSGLCVNPIQRGVSALTESASFEEVEKIADENPDDLWVTEGSFVYGNLCAAAGAPTLTSTNVYPNIEAWGIMDPDGDYEEVYLRYSNIDGFVDDDGSHEKFELLAGDHIRVNFTPEDLEKLGVKYLYTETEHSDTAHIDYEEVARCDGRYIYSMSYLDAA